MKQGGYRNISDIVREAIDQYLAQEQAVNVRSIKQDDEARKKRREEVKKKVVELWRYAQAFDRGVQK